MSTPSIDIVRAASPSLRMTEFRAAESDDSGLGLLTVRFSPFGTWYEINSLWEGNFMERTVRGAFKKTFKEQGSRIRCLFDHGYDPSIGNKVLAAVRDLREDADSAVLEGELFDTTYNRDLKPGLEAGVYGSSFRFRVIKEEWNDEPGESEHNPKGLPERTITEVRCIEAGPVTFPANPDATADLRSATDTYYEHVRSVEPERYEILRSRVAQTRGTPLDTAGPTTVRDDGAASDTDDEPQEKHSSKVVSSGARRRVLYL